MSLKGLLSRILPALEEAGVPYMLAGSVASSIHGEPRSTLDLDIVIDPTREQLVVFLRQFSNPDYYADEEQALEALTHRSQFNILDNVLNWKIDLIFSENSDYGCKAMSRRRRMEVGGIAVFVCSPEDVVIAKLRWAKMGESDRQLRDVRGILNAQGSTLDFAYIGRWAATLGVEDQWQAARKNLA